MEPDRSAEHEPAARLVFLALDGGGLAEEERLELDAHEPHEDEWAKGLTAMRSVMRDDFRARIVLGGRVEGYKGTMPGIAEEIRISLEAGQPVFVLGGFGGMRARRCGDGWSHRALVRFTR